MKISFNFWHSRTKASQFLTFKHKCLLGCCRDCVMINHCGARYPGKEEKEVVTSGGTRNFFLRGTKVFNLNSDNKNKIKLLNMFYKRKTLLSSSFAKPIKFTFKCVINIQLNAIRNIKSVNQCNDANLSFPIIKEKISIWKCHNDNFCK